MKEGSWKIKSSSKFVKKPPNKKWKEATTQREDQCPKNDVVCLFCSSDRYILNHNVPFYAFDRVERRSMSRGALRWIGLVVFIPIMQELLNFEWFCLINSTKSQLNVLEKLGQPWWVLLKSLWFDDMWGFLEVIS